ncbi:RNA-dependent RNA polymerase, partial [Tremellales sp. Uapishka_1]
MTSARVLPPFEDFINRGRDLQADLSISKPGPRGGRLGGPMKGSGDVQKWQFWPEVIAMGSLAGRQFNQVGDSSLQYPASSRDELPLQMFAAKCQQLPDPQFGNGMSFLAFDFRRELLVIRALLIAEDGQPLDPSVLPCALRPIDAELGFDDITSQGIHVVDRAIMVRGQKRHDVTVTVSCRRPPKFYTEFRSEKGYGPKPKGEFTPYRRRATAMDFAITSRVKERDSGPIQVVPDGPCAFPTYWNTYRWQFRLNTKQFSQFQACAHKIRLLALDDPQLDLLSAKSAAWEVRLLNSTIKQAAAFKMPDISTLPFSTRALIEGLVAGGIISPGDVNELRDALRANAVVPAFQDKILGSLFTEERVRSIPSLVSAKASYLRRSDTVTLPHLVMIRTVQVTPTRLLVGPTQQEPSNSVTRKYAHSLDAIMRVQFTDEDDKLGIARYTRQTDELSPDVGLMARVRRALQHGLLVGGELFLPIASSSSQQKDHAMWFINPRQIDSLSLRRWMGNVAETIVAKHAARMGLPFSTSRIVDLRIRIGPQLPDVERNGNTFTDGCAVAGSEIMRLAAKALGTDVGVNAAPSAIQFRLGGAKGVLVCWPTMAGLNEIRLRKSQIKFESELVDLNVVRMAKYQCAFLNRQFVMIMNANGVPEELFIELFQDAVTNLRGLRERVRANRLTKLDQNLISQCSDFPLATVIKAGFNADPLVLDIASIIECRALQDLKWRARLRLPTGVFLIGVCDESGLLREGELFCQYQDMLDKEPTVVTGEVLICRAPARDVRRAMAVDLPQLRHLKNTRRGRSGWRWQVDGNGTEMTIPTDYTLIWDKRFVDPLREAEPMNYTAPPPIRVPKVTQAELNEVRGMKSRIEAAYDLWQNFVQYILNDVLGQVDNNHLALCDSSVHGPFDPRCMKLSEIHSTAVDFAKTGQAAILDPELRPKDWPDFMDKDEEISYRSDKVLGKIFRIVQPDPHFEPCDLRKLGFPVDERFSLYPIYDSLLERLKPIKMQFENAIQYDMRRYRVFETEIPSGIALRNKRRKRARDQNLNEPIRESHQCHILAAREAAFKLVETMTFTGRLSPAQVVARHCYALTYQREHVELWEQVTCNHLWGGQGDIEEINQLRPRPMISFAWAFWQELVQIAMLSRIF